jgi:hypothetical protein
MRYREARRRGDQRVDGMDIERALKRIVELLRLKRRRKPEVFHGTATTIDQCFNLEQRRILFELLDDIEDQGYWPIKRAKLKELSSRGDYS